MKPIYPGNTVKIKAFFTDEEGTPLSPSVISLKIRTPDGTVTPYTNNELTNHGIGIWYMSYVPADPGHYDVRWETDSPDVSGESFFDVKPSRFP